MAAAKLTAAVLMRQDDICSTAVIQLLANSAAFHALSKSEGELIVSRDKEDEDKLAKGIEIGIKKGILQGKPDVAPVTPINVVGLTASQVTEEIVKRLPGKEGNVIILQGLSGTGKGTTVSKLKDVLPRCVTWSNGNVFRSYTYLINEVLSKEGKEISTENLTAELVDSVAKRVTFEYCEDDKSFHTLLDGKVRVEGIQNTALKTPLISSKVPTVAEQTQGEVIRFGAGAVQKLSAAGYNVILEGRAQTLNYIPTNLRFELVIPDVAVLGQRRAAQRVMAKALSMAGANVGDATEEQVSQYVHDAVGALH